MKIAISSILSVMAALSFVSSASATETSLLSDNYEPTEIFAEKESTAAASLTDFVNGSSGEIATSGQDEDPMLPLEVVSDAGRDDSSKDVSIQLRGTVASFMSESGGLGGCQSQRGGFCAPVVKKCCSGLSCSSMMCFGTPRQIAEPCSPHAACGPNLVCLGYMNGFPTGTPGMCSPIRKLGQDCQEGQCDTGLSCGKGKCYHKPRRFGEPCGGLDPCDKSLGLACGPIGMAIDNDFCGYPCVPLEKSKAIKAKEEEIETKKKEMQDASESLSKAVTYYSAKLRGETQFIAEELHTYYSQKVEYCIDVDMDTRAQYDFACNPDNYEDGEFEMGYECGCRPRAEDSPGKTKICNNDATRAEVIIHDDLSHIETLNKTIISLEKELEELTVESDKERYMKDQCMEIYNAKMHLLNKVTEAVEAVKKFVEDFKCVIVKVLFMLMGTVIDQVVGKLPFIIPLKANPICNAPIDFKKFKLQLPGGVFTGNIAMSLFTGVFCWLSTLDDAMFFFGAICQNVAIMSMVTNALLNGVCGNFGSAFVAIAEPLVLCNVWDCGDGDGRCIYPIRFDCGKCNEGGCPKPKKPDGYFLDAMTKTSLPIATTLDYDMVDAMAEQSEIMPVTVNLVPTFCPTFPFVPPVTADIVNEATSSNLRGASKIQLQLIPKNVDGFLANESQLIQEGPESNNDKDTDLSPGYLQDGIDKTKCFGPGQKCCASFPCCGSGYSCSAGTCKAPNGSTCSNDKECSSGLCIGNKCSSPQPNGSTCSGFKECSSGLCIGNKCASKQPNGTTCSVNQACISHNCSSGRCSCGTNGSFCTFSSSCCGNNYCQGLKCVAKKARGSRCFSKNECQSNRCSWFKCR